MRKKTNRDSIKEAIQAGYKVKEISELLDVSMSTVYRVIKELEQEDKQKETEVETETETDIKGDSEMAKMLVDGKIVEVSDKKEVVYSTEKREDDSDKLNPLQKQLLNIFKADEINVPEEKEEEVTVITTEHGRKTPKEYLKEMNPATSPFAKNEWKDIEYKRGDIVYIHLDGEDLHPGVQDFERYAVIIQNDIGNKYAGIVIVAMLTSIIKKTDMPTHVVLQKGSALPKQSMVMCEQIRTVSKGMITKRGSLTPSEMNNVDKALAASIALDRYTKEVESLKYTIDKMKNGDNFKDGKNWWKEYNLLKVEYDKLLSNTQNNTDKGDSVSIVGKSSRFEISLKGENYSFSIKDGAVLISDNQTGESLKVDAEKLEVLAEDIKEILNIIK